jgi:citrate synthase
MVTILDRLDQVINVDYRQRMGELVDARTAAQRLGVDVRSLYAYVSRGALRRVPGPDGRSSRYDSDELELLARRSRPRTLPRPAASIDLVIATRVSTVTDGRVRYRGTDVLDLVASGEPFEAVAGLLWGAGRSAAPPAWPLPAGPAASARGIVAALGDSVPVARRFAAVVAGAAGPAGAADPPDWPSWGRFLIAALIEASGPAAAQAAGGSVTGGSVTGGPVAERLWRRWSSLRPTPARVRALNTALVLLAEHELALSTLAVRVAASARAAPPGCVLAGLGPLSGTLHGDVARLVQERLARRRTGAAPRAGMPADRADGPVAALGFGHPVHRHGDPRTVPLLRAVYAIATRADRDLIESAQAGAPAPPNIDLALGALCYVARMPPPASTAIFAIARTAGWTAHAAEEYTEPYLRFRGRAVLPARRPG